MAHSCIFHALSVELNIFRLEFPFKVGGSSLPYRI